MVSRIILQRDTFTFFLWVHLRSTTLSLLLEKWTFFSTWVFLFTFWCLCFCISKESLYFCHICLHTSSLWGDDLGEAGRKHDESNRIADPAQVLQEPITIQSAIYPLLSCGHTNHTDQAQCVKPSSQIYSAVTDLYNKTGTGRSRLVSLSESIKHAAGEMCLNFSTCEIWHFWWISKVQVSNFNFLVCTVCLLIFPPPWSPLLSLLTYFFTPNFFLFTLLNTSFIPVYCTF